jgi:hypothetical protein
MNNLAILLLFIIQSVAFTQTAFNYPPLHYADAPVKNDIQQLQEKLNSKEISLDFDSQGGYLKAVLNALEIPIESQTLVFSKTSFQRELISIKTPRAIYFNDQTYVGWIPNSKVLEIMSNDAKLGSIFYTMSQKETLLPKFQRNDHDCLDCHSSARTQSVPGGMIKSRFIDEKGLLRSNIVTHRTPIKDRWGSWYVTGNSSQNPHLGNLSIGSQLTGNNTITDLTTFFNTKPYISSSSDIVALMVMEHQIHMNNLITRAAFRSRIILHKEKVNEAQVDNIPNSALENIQTHIDPLVDYMLFIDEAKIDGPIIGNTQFREKFEAKGIKDKKGRSLKLLNLKSRLFEYPLSYCIYSDAIQKLPAIARKILFDKVRNILTGQITHEKYQHLTPKLRQDILEILKDTLKGF